MCNNALMSTSTHIAGGTLTETQAKTVPLWMAEDGLADTENEAEKARIRIDIANIKTAQG